VDIKVTKDDTCVGVVIEIEGFPYFAENIEVHMLNAAVEVVETTMLDFGASSKINDGLQADRGELIKFGVGKTVDGVGAKECAPLDRSTISGCITTEIAKVKRAFKTQASVWMDSGEGKLFFIHKSEATCSGRVHVDS
jgi:hypothetical protein